MRSALRSESVTTTLRPEYLIDKLLPVHLQVGCYIGQDSVKGANREIPMSRDGDMMLVALGKRGQARMAARLPGDLVAIAPKQGR